MTLADRAGEVMKAHFLQYNIESNIYVSKISNRGARTLVDYNFAG